MSFIKNVNREGGSCTLTATVYQSVAGQAITYVRVGRY
jgi:hypothetical protein